MGEMSSTPAPEPGANAMTDRFRTVAASVLDSLLADAPEWASALGDHRHADRLTDHSTAAESERAATLVDALGALDEIDDTLLPPDDRVDLELLRGRVTGDLWRLTEVRPHLWDPLLRSPDRGLYQLVVRADLPLSERLRALAGRCRAVPEFLAAARADLDTGPGMPRVHVETALGRARGAHRLLGSAVDELLAAASAADTGVPDDTAAARDSAREAMAEYIAWLESRLETAVADPRLGERNYAAQLWYTLDCELSPETLLTRAESDLMAVEEEIAEVAAGFDGAARHSSQVREVLDRVAAEAATDSDTLLPDCRDAVRHLAARLADLDLVTVPDTPVEVIAMPEARRGVAPAYCDAPGPLAPHPTGPRPATLVAVAGPPSHWPAERAASFHREYNRHMVRNLMAHEALPGHALQAAHESGYRGPTAVRAALGNAAFCEGWAVYAEEMVARAGWSDAAADRKANAALRLSQLKMRLRVLLNAILDVRVHTNDIDEREALALLTERGHQEEAEALGKWRRAQLTCAQMSAYYVGYRELSGLARDLAAARPRDIPRQIHDAVLGHGAPAPRHLRTLLGVGT